MHPPCFDPALQVRHCSMMQRCLAHLGQASRQCWACRGIVVAMRSGSSNSLSELRKGPLLLLLLLLKMMMVMMVVVVVVVLPPQWVW